MVCVVHVCVLGASSLPGLCSRSVLLSGYGCACCLPGAAVCCWLYPCIGVLMLLPDRDETERRKDRASCVSCNGICLCFCICMWTESIKMNMSNTHNSLSMSVGLRIIFSRLAADVRQRQNYSRVTSEMPVRLPSNLNEVRGPQINYNRCPLVWGIF